MQRERVETVAGRLLGCSFPIGIDSEALRRAEHFQPAVGTTQQHVEIKFGFAEKLFQRGTVFRPSSEDQTAVELDARLLQPQLVLRADIAVHLLALDRRADKAAVGSKRPAVVNAAVHGGVAVIGHTHTHAAVRTEVEQHIDLIAPIARDDHLILAHVAHDEVAGLGNFGFVRKQQPGAAKNALHFQLVDFAIGKHPHRDFAVGNIDQIFDFDAVG